MARANLAQTSQTLGLRWASTSVPNHGLDSIPSPAEATGQPAVDSQKGKVWDDVDEAVKDIQSGSMLLSAGESHLLTGTGSCAKDRFRTLRHGRDDY